MTGNKDEGCLNGGAVICLRGVEERKKMTRKKKKKEGEGDHEMTARELKLSSGICLTFP